jgi:hypothetical protein
MTTDGPGGVKIFLLSHGQVNILTPIFVPSTKKQDVTKCTNKCTIVLFSHTNKILLRISQKDLDLYIGHDTSKEQEGLNKGRGTREQITIVSESWRAQRAPKKSICFRLHKDFDSVHYFKKGTAKEIWL